jgi:hypothetical protein
VEIVKPEKVCGSDYYPLVFQAARKPDRHHSKTCHKEPCGKTGPGTCQCEQEHSSGMTGLGYSHDNIYLALRKLLFVFNITSTSL